jgi:hypothetical protein
MGAEELEFPEWWEEDFLAKDRQREDFYDPLSWYHQY